MDRDVPMLEREFIAWDGEGINDRFILLANSNGDEIHDPTGLSTHECFEFLARGGRRERARTANVWYGFGYDVNMMLCDIPWRNLRELNATGRTWWEGWTIKYIPRKMFSISRPDCSFVSYDSMSFYQTTFIRALTNWGISVPDIITEGKEARSDFGRWDMQSIIRYNAEECRLLVQMMNGLRDSIKEAGWNLRGWYGPGALAGWFLSSIHAERYIQRWSDLPFEYAYFGGRIDTSGWGDVSPAYHYDITSAYPAAMTACPDLSLLTWDHRKVWSGDPFALVLVSWKVPETTAWGPLPWRDKDGHILYPAEGMGWYWGVELEAARRRFERRMRIKIHASIEPFGKREYPLRQHIETAFKHRRLLKRVKNPAHVAIKLGLNSLYGKTAQRVSFGNKRIPRFHTLAWAGYLTAMTRAKLSDAMAETDAVAVMTDAIFSRTPFDKVTDDERLGGWSGDKIDRLTIIEPGVYECDGERFSRGYERESMPPIPEIAQRFRGGESEIGVRVKRFVGLGLAMMGGEWESSWRHFVTMDRQIHNPQLFGTTKRMPNLEAKRAAEWNPLSPYPLVKVETSRPYYVAKNHPVLSREEKEDRALEEIED